MRRALKHHAELITLIIIVSIVTIGVVSDLAEQTHERVAADAYVYIASKALLLVVILVGIAMMLLAILDVVFKLRRRY